MTRWRESKLGRYGCIQLQSHQPDTEIEGPKSREQGVGRISGYLETLKRLPTPYQVSLVTYLGEEGWKRTKRGPSSKAGWVDGEIIDNPPILPRPRVPCSGLWISPKLGNVANSGNSPRPITFLPGFWFQCRCIAYFYLLWHSFGE